MAPFNTQIHLRCTQLVSRPPATLLLAALLLLITAAHGHQCGYDELEASTAKSARFTGLSYVVKPETVTTATGSARHPQYAQSVLKLTTVDDATTSSSDSTWQPIRIRVFTLDLDDSSRYCTRVAQKRPDFKNSTLTCTAGDVLTDAKKAVLTELLIPTAVKMHEDRLNVQRVDGNLVVGSVMASDTVCRQFSIPTEHTTTGVSDADFVLYMSAGPTTGNTIAWAMTCQVFADNRRPSMGVSNVSPRYISADPQTVRVITHELLHALGFNTNSFQEHGMYDTAVVRGKTAAPVIISPNVVAQAQAQYGCPTQTFMELEDQGGSGTAFSHWKRRSAKDELMAGISGVGRYTALTIAAMEDMGFYRGNYANAEPMSYGQNAGCSLTTSKCVVDGVTQFPEMFCDTDSDQLRCTSDRRGLGKCTVAQYIVPLAAAYQYYSDSTKGGSDALMDYCPDIEAYTNSNCTENTGLLIGGVYGVMSRCLSASISVKVGTKQNNQYGICAAVSCGASTYQIKVYGASSYTTCTPGSTHTLSSLSSKFKQGSIECPSFDAVCGEDTTASQYSEYRALLGSGAGAVRAVGVAVCAVLVLQLVLFL